VSDINRNDESFVELKIDRGGLGGGYDSVLQPEALSTEDIDKYKEPLTPLGKELQSYINNRGPMSLNEFMTQALTHNQHGYYQNKLNNSNKIGSSGDFITSPEISSLFGEMITVWCVSMWENMKCPPKFKLVECGPGNGTLMKQILSVSSRRFPAFHAAARVNLVEVSDEMQRIQFEELGCKKIETPVAQTDAVSAAYVHAKLKDTGSSVSPADGVKNNNSYGSTTRVGVVRDADVPRRAPGNRNRARVKSDIGEGSNSTAADQRVTVEAVTEGGVPVTWYKQFFQISDSSGKDEALPLLAIGQEFLDTFPVYQFIHTSGGWREKLVDIDSSPDSPYHFRVVLASKPTPASHLLLGGDTSGVGIGVGVGQELDLSGLVSEKSLLHGLLRVTGRESLDLGCIQPTSAAAVGEESAGTDSGAPPVAPPARTLSAADSVGTDSGAPPVAPPARTLSAADSVGIEVSPMALGLCEAVTQYIRAHGGAALFIDYGEAHTQADSLRGFLRHQQVNFLSSVGHVDISSDVDFHACRTVVHRTQRNMAADVGGVDGIQSAGSGGAGGPEVLTPSHAGTIILDTAGSSMQIDMTPPATPDEGADRTVLVSDVVTQSDFLLRLGIIGRVQQLLEYENPPGGAHDAGETTEGLKLLHERELSDEEANNMVNGMKMLVSPTEMGHRFKSICICHKDILENSKTGSLGPLPGAEFPNMPAFTAFS